MKAAAFSNPYNGQFPTLFERLSIRQYAALCERVRRMCEQHGVGRDPIVEQLSAKLADASPSVSYNSPEAACVHHEVVLPSAGIDEATVRWAQTQLAIVGFLSGLLPSIEIQYAGGKSLVLAGRELASSRLSILGSGSRLVIRDGDEHTICEVRNVAGEGHAPLWITTDGTESVAPFGSSASVILSSTRTPWLGAAEDALPAVPAASTYAMQYSRTARMLEQHCPAYYVWVAVAAREIVPVVRLSESLIRSSSYTFSPGHLRITSPASLVETAEMLVHECCHQYFNLALRFGPMQVADAPMALSPLTKSKRPLDRILIGFHAFGNVLLMFDELMRNGGESSPGRKQTAEGYLEKLSETLEHAWEEHLTDLGKSLYLPLRARLVKAGYDYCEGSALPSAVCEEEVDRHVR